MDIPPQCWETLKAKEEEWTAEDEMVRQHLRLNGRESEQTLGDSGGPKNTEDMVTWFAAICRVKKIQTRPNKNKNNMHTGVYI